MTAGSGSIGSQGGHDVNRSLQDSSGFTVLEALIALAILTGVTASVLSLLGAMRAVQTRSHSKLIATIEARTLLDRLGRDIPLQAGVSSGILADGRQWSLRIQPYADDVVPTGSLLLFDVQIQVGLDGEEPIAALRTLLRPIR
jgi:type II secretion system protein I